jgi:uncharacterized protein YdcH (DUF465 family)
MSEENLDSVEEAIRSLKRKYESIDSRIKDVEERIHTVKKEELEESKNPQKYDEEEILDQIIKSAEENGAVNLRECAAELKNEKLKYKHKYDEATREPWRATAADIAEMNSKQPRIPKKSAEEKRRIEVGEVETTWNEMKGRLGIRSNFEEKFVEK